MRSIDDLPIVPRLAETRMIWRDVSERLDRQFALLTGDALDAPAPQRYPIEDRSVLGALAFLMQHDAYHIGQLALLRKFHGASAMRYG